MQNTDSGQDLTKAFREFVELALLVYTIMDLNPKFTKSDMLADKNALHDAQTYFNQIIEKIESFSLETREILKLSLQLFNDDETHLIKKILIKNAIDDLILFFRIESDVVKSYLDTFKALESFIKKDEKIYLTLEGFYSDFISELHVKRLKYTNEKPLSIFSLQAALSFQNSVEHLSAPTSIYAIFFYHTYYHDLLPILESHPFNERSQLFINYMLDILNTDLSPKQNYNKFLSEKITLDHFPDNHSNASQTTEHVYKVYRKNRDYVANHRFFKLPEFGIQCFLYELPSKTFKISEPYPEYFLELASLQHHLIVIGFCSKRYIKKMKRRFKRILKITYSRSMASYLFTDERMYSPDFDHIASQGYPCLVRNFNFKYFNNVLKKKYLKQQITFEDLEKLYNFGQLISYFEDPIIKTTFEEQSFKQYFIYINHLLNRLPTRELMTNFPTALGLLNHAKSLIVYIKFFFDSNLHAQQEKITHNTAIRSQNLAQQNTLDDLKNNISKYFQFWSDRAEVMELKTELYAILRLSHLEEYFIFQLKNLIRSYEQVYPTLHIIVDTEIFDKNIGTANNSRIRMQIPLVGPDLKTFNKKTGEFDIVLPTKERISKDLNITDAIRPKVFFHDKGLRLKAPISRIKHVFLKRGKPLLSLKNTGSSLLKQLDDNNAIKIYEYLRLHSPKNGLTVDEIMKGTKIRKTTVYDALKRLEIYELVGKQQIKATGVSVGRPKVYYFVDNKSDKKS